MIFELLMIFEMDRAASNLDPITKVRCLIINIYFLDYLLELIDAIPKRVHLIFQLIPYFVASESFVCDHDHLIMNTDHNHGH